MSQQTDGIDMIPFLDCFWLKDPSCNDIIMDKNVMENNNSIAHHFDQDQTGADKRYQQYNKLPPTDKIFIWICGGLC